MKSKIFKNNNIIKNNKNIILSEKDKKVLIKRSSRLGDILMSFSLLNRFNENGYKIYYSTKDLYRSLFNYLNYEVIYVDNNNYNKEFYDEFYDINKIHSNGFKVATKLDMFYAICGYDPSSYTKLQKLPQLNIERIKECKFKFSDKINIAIAIESYNPNSPRSIKIENLYDLIIKYKEFDFILIGQNPVKTDRKINNLINATGNTPLLDDIISLIYKCNYVITIDTGIMHLAGALNIPQLTIFGPTRPEFLASIYNNLIVLDANRKCSPCWEKGCESICTPTLRNNILELGFEELVNDFHGYKVISYDGEVLKYEI